MTLKEQIMKLQTYKMYEGEDTIYVERDEVLKLLEQQPSREYISRFDVLNLFNYGKLDEDIVYSADVMNAVRALPAVTPKVKWIPVSERLPEDGTWNLWTDGKKISPERYKLDAIDHFFPEGRWFDFENAIAWMPLPDPYKVD